MTRHLLTAALLVLAVSAHAVSPAHQDADGGGSCPQTEASPAESSLTASTATPEPDARATAPSAAPLPAGKATAVRSHPGARWHSFLPGMFK